MNKGECHHSLLDEMDKTTATTTTATKASCTSSITGAPTTNKNSTYDHELCFFKPKFSGTPEENQQAHLLRMIDSIHIISEQIKE